MKTKRCTDTVIGDILAGWRYDISGLSPEMRTDYEQHFVECSQCRSRQRFHRTVDVALITLSSVSICAFIMALSVIHHIEPLRVLAVTILHVRQLSIAVTLQEAAFGGLLFSGFVWILIAIATPVPAYLSSVARAQARGWHGRIPEEVKERLPKLSA
jgi:hypothetical protein